MLANRFIPIAAVVRAGQQPWPLRPKVATSAGTLSTNNALFVFLLVLMVLLIRRARDVSPACAGSEMAEQLMMVLYRKAGEEEDDDYAMNRTPYGRKSPQGVASAPGAKASMSALAKRAVIGSFAKLTRRASRRRTRSYSWCMFGYPDAPACSALRCAASPMRSRFHLRRISGAVAHGAVRATSRRLIEEDAARTQTDSLRPLKRDISIHKADRRPWPKGTYADGPGRVLPAPRRGGDEFGRPPGRRTCSS